MRRRRSPVVARALALVVAFEATHAARFAHAAPSAFAVSVDGCEGLRAAEIERVLQIELSSVTTSWKGTSPLRVELSCQASRVHLVAIDPVTDKRLSRDVEIDVGAVDRERTIAILVSQLFLTSWSELLLAPPVDPPKSLPPPPPAPPALVDSLTDRVHEAQRPPLVHPWIAIVAGYRLRDQGSDVLDPHVSLRPSIDLGDHARLALDVGGEHGATGRSLGMVDLTFATASLLGAVVARPAPDWAIAFGAFASASYVSVEPHVASNIPAFAVSAHGFISEAGLSIVPTWTIGGLRLGLDLSAGASLSSAVAHVEGDRDIVVGGRWISLSVLAGGGASSW